MTIIDFDDPSSFPEALSNWDVAFEQEIQGEVRLDDVTEWWQIEQQLQDMHIHKKPIVTDFLNTHLDSEVAVCHCSRILDIKHLNP